MNSITGIGLSYNNEKNLKMRDQIRSFRDLAPGWHYGEGRGATKLAIKAALSIQSYFVKYGINEIEVFPDIDGGILVSGYHEKHTLEVFCDQDGHTNLLHEINDESHHERDNVPMDEIVEYLGGLPWRSKNVFDFFIQSTTVRANNDLQALHSKIHQAMVEFQSLTLHVHKKIAGLNANTYDTFISHNRQETHLFSGGLKPPSYQKTLYSNENRQLMAIDAT